jgi:ZIP family zinc transporter
VPWYAALAVGLFLVFSVVGARAGRWKLLGISWIAFLAMAGAIPLGARGAREGTPRALAWGYGLASGAMVTSAALFLLPQALGPDPSLGGLGVALGLLVGFAVHTAGHRFAHADWPGEHALLALSAHALAAGTIIGVVYGALPDLGALLGVAIVSHKGPAGYAAARRLAAGAASPWSLLVPAAGVGLTAIPVGLVADPFAPAVQALVFGFAAGVFLHVALDFLPACEHGGDVYDVVAESAHAHRTLDRLRIHAVVSTAVGAIAVVLAWRLVQ